MSGLNNSLEIRCELIRLRQAKGIGQVELAKKLGRTQSWLSKLESGANHLRVEDIFAYAAAIGVKPVITIEESQDEQTVPG